jgi:hypothetical protein
MKTYLIEPIVLDNLIPKPYQIDLSNKLISNFDYHYQNATSVSRENTTYDVYPDKNTIDSPQFVHHALMDGVPSDAINLIRPMFFFVEERLNRKISDVGRVKINGLLRNGKNFTSDNYNIPHTDDPQEGILSMIYYIHDSDGDTFFFNESYGQTQSGITFHSRVSPKMGRAVIFDSRRFHAGSNPIESESRFIINVTLKLENERQTLENMGQGPR